MDQRYLLICGAGVLIVAAAFFLLNLLARLILYWLFFK